MQQRKIDYTGPESWPAIRDWLSGRQDPGSSVERSVQEILLAVRNEGDEALVRYTQRFDCPGFDSSMLRVPASSLREAKNELPREDLRLIEEAAANIRAYHERQRENSWLDTRENGLVLGQLVRPVDRAGLYVPGGKSGETPLVSSLIMNAVPALVAGVGRTIAVSPPGRDGSLNPYTLAAAEILGIEEVYAVGSAWAVAALAYGTQTVPGVDVVAGPGNIHVTTAKRLLLGRVGIDMIAGPSEVAILADGSADPAWLAADLLSQAEHDELASAVLVSADDTLLEAVDSELHQQLADLPRAEVAASALRNWGALIKVPDAETGMELINRLAPEHFELCLQDPWSWIGSVRNAGAVFVGQQTPEPLGDYFAGPNHILPTVGTARFSSALSVQHFCKKSSLLAASPSHMSDCSAKVARLARLEGLEAHARSAEKRGARKSS